MWVSFVWQQLLMILCCLLYGLLLAGAVQAGPGLLEARLQFDQQKTFKVVAPNARLHANAYLQLQNADQAGVIWQVARLEQPLVDVEALAFQSIGEMQLIRASRNVLLSPSLPTEQLGVYVVQLSVSSGEVYYLHYQVVQDFKPSLLASASIELLSPTPRQIVLPNASTHFLWLHSAPVAAYRYELYVASVATDFAQLSSPPSQAPLLVGQLLAAQQSRWQFDPALIGRLPRSGRYFWRVVGLGLDGATISRSQLQMITLQF